MEKRSVSLGEKLITMGEYSEFRSRTGKLTCTKENVFNFVTDIRNFRQFVTNDSIRNWQADRESCSFEVPPVGSVTVRLSEKEPCERVLFTGDALQSNEFSLLLVISGNGNEPAEVRVMLRAELNPLMKMMVTKPLEQFLEILINEMEKFRGWDDTIA